MSQARPFPSENTPIYTSPHVTRHTANDQGRWNEFSHETVSALATMLAEQKRPSAREIMQFLGARRQAIVAQYVNFYSDFMLFWHAINHNPIVN